MKVNLLYLSYFLWLFLPSFMYVNFGGGLGLGSCLAAFLQLCFFFVLTPKTVISTKIMYLIWILLVVCIALNSIFSEYSVVGVRQLGVFIFLALAVLCSALLVSELKSYSIIDIRRYFESIVLVVIVWTVTFYLVPMTCLNYENFVKNLFPYSEPSHYVLSAGFILFTAGPIVSNKYKIASFLTFIFVGLSMPSLISLVLCAFYLIHFKWLFTVKGIVISFLVGALSFAALYNILDDSSYQLDDVKYYMDRINFSSSNENLSFLVYLQGFLLIISNLQEYPLGLGIQNLGMEQPIEISLLIYDLAGEFKNRNDGGFLASKFISEFGVVGLFGILIYLIHWLRLLFLMIYRRESFTDVQLLYMSGYLVFVIELFVRGTGYFSFGVLLLFVYFISAGERKGNPTPNRIKLFKMK